MRSGLIVLWQIVGILIFSSIVSAQRKETLGWLEKVLISPPEVILTAKLDTGADSSSLNASEFREFQKAGKKWVSFEVSDRNGSKSTLERPVIRTAMVKKRFGKPESRPVIRLGICSGTRYMEADVNLVDRSNFESQMLLGRSFLAGNVIVDPAMTFTAEPHCIKSASR